MTKMTGPDCVVMCNLINTVAVRAYDGSMSMIQRVGEVSFTVPWALRGEIQSHAMLVMLVGAWTPGEGGIVPVEKELQKACRSNVMS